MAYLQLALQPIGNGLVSQYTWQVARVPTALAVWSVNMIAIRDEIPNYVSIVSVDIKMLDMKMQHST